MMLGHKLVYVVVVAVLDARADAPAPRGPEAVADPAPGEGRCPHTIGELTAAEDSNRPALWLL